jgi:hypothetical protein
MLPSTPFVLAVDVAPEQAAERIARAIGPELGVALPRWRVRGEATAAGVHLFYSWKPRAVSLAPHLYARWVRDGGRVRLEGAFRQAPAAAKLVLASGVVMAGMLVALAVRHGLPWTWALAGAALLVGYPWISWFMTNHHCEKIAALVAEAVAATRG